MTEPLPPDDAATADLLRRAARDEAPPAAVHARVVALDNPTHRLGRRGSTLLRRLVAVALPESGGSGFAPAFGVRGAAPAGQQWLFKADECEIDLRTSPRGERWSVAGQLFGALQAERVVLDGGAEPVSVEIGPSREFRFTDLPMGRYSLTVQGGECEIVIPQFVVGEPDMA